jgi:hypothetical protein
VGPHEVGDERSRAANLCPISRSLGYQLPGGLTVRRHLLCRRRVCGVGLCSFNFELSTFDVRQHSYQHRRPNNPILSESNFSSIFRFFRLVPNALRLQFQPYPATDSRQPLLLPTKTHPRNTRRSRYSADRAQSSPAPAAATATAHRDHIPLLPSLRSMSGCVHPVAAFLTSTRPRPRTRRASALSS